MHLERNTTTKFPIIEFFAKKKYICYGKFVLNNTCEMKKN